MKKFVQVFGKIFFLNTWTNFFTLGQFFLTLSNFSEFFLVFSWKNTLFLKTRQKCEKALSFTHCSFSVFKKLSSYNLLFSWVFRFEKWQPRTIPRSRPTASTSKRTSAAILGISKPSKKAKLYLDNFSSHLEKTMREGKYHCCMQQRFVRQTSLFFAFFLMKGYQKLLNTWMFNSSY